LPNLSGNVDIAFYMSRKEVVSLESWFLSNQSNLSFQKVLIGWIKPVLQKGHYIFGHVNRLKPLTKSPHYVNIYTNSKTNMNQHKSDEYFKFYGI